jgi:nucleolar protein 56
VKGLKIYVVDTIAGSHALDEAGREVAFEPAPKSLDDLMACVMKISSGEVHETFAKLAEKLKQMSPEEVVVESEEEAKYLSQQGLKASAAEGNTVAVSVRSRLPQLLLESGLVKSEEEVLPFELSVTYEFTRRGLMGAAKKRDMLAAHSIRTIDDIDKTVNLFVNRLREWYSVHFPELNDIVEDHRLYVKLVASLGSRENFSESSLKELGVPEQLAGKILDASKRSLGADISEHDLEAIRTFASIILQLYELRDQLEGYVNRIMKEVAPNITELVGPLLGARLISLAGGLDRLATMPASTIQVLGAEKALFRALRTGGRPPKHGIIFQYPEIFRAPKWQRGKIARALAAKLAIAAKVDAFSGRFVGDRLNAELRERIDEIKKIYAAPPKKKAAQQPQQRFQAPPRRGGRGREGRHRGRGR